jgi:magnesium transporter
MVSVFVHRNGATEQVEAVDPSWLDPASGVVLWVDLAAPTADEARILERVFRFHPLAIEDAIAEVHHPKIEAYDGYLYFVLHGIDFQASTHHFATHDTDFFIGPNYLVTVHDGQTRSIAHARQICERNNQVLAEGSVALMHRIIDTMVDHYRPEVDQLEQKLEELEATVFENPGRDAMREMLALKRDVASLRRVTLPQRDAVARLARREFAFITNEMAYRFRDVHDQLVRLADEALVFHDRVSSLVDAHLSNTSNRLNEVMKTLTIITAIAVPFTVMGGLYGMNVELPGVREDGSSSPYLFWAIVGGTAIFVAFMTFILRRLRKI